ncbi:unnamed protein product [Calicophoron daubneyi]|uniref:Tc1-like transposase DDE domain-containing protein n=1 Tax=Calicophoron daubneyi TaxID=300641 RepID=A0AAV2T0D3_CALDB
MVCRLTTGEAVRLVVLFYSSNENVKETVKKFNVEYSSYRVVDDELVEETIRRFNLTGCVRRSHCRRWKLEEKRRPAGRWVWLPGGQVASKRGKTSDKVIASGGPLLSLASTEAQSDWSEVKKEDTVVIRPVSACGETIRQAHWSGAKEEDTIVIRPSNTGGENFRQDGGASSVYIKSEEGNENRGLTKSASDVVTDSLNQPKHRNYNGISLKQRRRITEASERDEDWCMIAEANAVSLSTAYQWFYADPVRYESFPRRVARTRILDDAEVDCLLEWLTVDPTATLESLRMRIRAEFGKNISHCSVGSNIDGRCIAMNKARDSQSGVDAEDIQGNRRGFIRHLMECYAEHKMICWIDEINLNLFCTRKFGRNIRVRKFGALVTSCRGENLHVMSAMTEDGVFSYAIRRQRYSAADCREWVTSVLSDFEQRTAMSDLVIVCDNSPYHSELERVFEEERYRGGRLMWLSPYLPSLNPIENVWNIVKSEVRRKLKEMRCSIVEGDPDGVLSRREWRMQKLESIVLQAMNGMTADRCSSFVKSAWNECMKIAEEDDVICSHD